MKKFLIKKHDICKWLKGICTVLCALLIVSCIGKGPGKVTEKYLKIVDGQDGVSFVDVKTNEKLRYNKLIIFNKDIDKIFPATIGIGSLGVGVSWKDEGEELTRIISHDMLEKKMKYTLENGVLTIDVL